MGSSSHDLGAELRMHSFTVNCDTFSNEEKVAAVVAVTSIEVTCSEAMLALSFSTLLVKCLMKILSVLTIWCSSLLEDARAILQCKIYTWLCAQVLKPSALPVRTSP